MMIYPNLVYIPNHMTWPCVQENLWLYWSFHVFRFLCFALLFMLVYKLNVIKEWTLSKRLIISLCVSVVVYGLFAFTSYSLSEYGVYDRIGTMLILKYVAIYGLAALTGATLMFIGAFLPNIFYGVEIWGVKSYDYANLFQIGWGVLVFLLTLAILGLSYFKQIFWAGLTSALCLTITFLQAIIVPVSYKLAGGYVSEYIKAGVHVGWFFILFGELAVIGAFALYYFVMNKDEAPAIEAEATAVDETETVAEAVVEATVETPVTEETATDAE